MKVNAIVTISMALLALAQTALAEQTCYQYPNALTPHQKKAVPCPMVTVPKDDPSQFASTDNMFDVDFSCGDNDQTRCTKAKNTFIEAGRLISQQLVLKQRVKVGARFIDVCTEIPDCEGVLGAAGPAQTIPLEDEDGVTRLYPQALVKQFEFDQAPQFGAKDIDAVFNTKFPFHFFEDGDTISQDEEDFLTVVLHEFIHGLGFTSGWNDYINQEPQDLTPAPQVQNTTDGSQLSFIEMAFDRYMIADPSGKKQSMPKIAAQIEEFDNTAASIASSESELISNFKASAQGTIAKNTFQFAITDGALAFVPTAGKTDPLILETSLNPFRQGSSVSHLDMKRYTGQPDFLMRFAAPPGKTLKDNMKDNNADQPIGPGIVSLLNSLGYATADNPNPYKPKVPSGSGSGSTGGSDGGNTGGSDGGNTGGSDGGNTGGSDGGSDGGSTGGSDGGNTSGSDGGSTGGSDGGNTSGSDGGSDGGNTSGSDGGSDGGNTGGSTDGGSTDGGSDGGNTGGSDGGSTDGGSTDGGSDGGNTGGSDGGSTDGGSSDGGSTDGGSSDGGSTDGGSTDGGSSDGGSTDGGSTDSGSTDGSDGGSSDGSDGSDPFNVSDEFNKYSARFRF